MQFNERDVEVQGRRYRVRIEEGENAKVWAIIHRSPVSSRGFYQTDTVYRTIKLNSQNYKAALRAFADAEKSL